ncbi:MAG: arginase [Elusimicrobia bacterium]|nr:arginase [Elusimicrobiota bacterium]
MDWGASKRGAAGGPAAIRRAGLPAALELLGFAVEDAGDVEVPAEPGPIGRRSLRYAPTIHRVCKALAAETYAAVKRGALPVTLGGDHSLAMGSVSGVARWFREHRQKLGLLWVDAHGDINTPRTSPSGNVHGMPLAHLLGMGEPKLRRLAGFEPAIDAARVALIGVRDLDATEKANLKRSGIRVVTMMDIDRYGMARAVEQAIHLASAGGTAPFHLSFDVDAADPSIAQGVGTPKRGGLTYREAHLLMELAAESGRLVSLDLAEVNPLEDAHNQTAELACELVQSALGKRIY